MTFKKTSFNSKKKFLKMNLRKMDLRKRKREVKSRKMN